MGYSKNLFVDQTKDLSGFTCSICRNVLEEPVIAEPCKHIFCSKCIRPMWEPERCLVSKAVGCPFDRQTIVSFKMPEQTFMDKLDALELVCPCDGCSSTTELGNIDEHLKTCPFNDDALLECARPDGCKLTVKRKEMEDHNCMQYLRRELQTINENLEKTTSKLWTTEDEFNVLLGLSMELEERKRHDREFSLFPREENRGQRNARDPPSLRDICVDVARTAILMLSGVLVWKSKQILDSMARSDVE